jgi:hypothetical protein
VAHWPFAQSPPAVWPAAAHGVPFAMHRSAKQQPPLAQA